MFSLCFACAHPLLIFFLHMRCILHYITSFTNTIPSVTALDLSSGMIAQVNEKLKDRDDLSNVTTLCLHLKDDNCASLKDSFDLVITSMTAHHVPNFEAMVHTLVQVLKPGGQVRLRMNECLWGGRSLSSLSLRNDHYSSSYSISY